LSLTSSSDDLSNFDSLSPLLHIHSNGTQLATARKKLPHSTAENGNAMDPKKWNKLNNTHPPPSLTALLSGTTQVSRYQKGKTNLDFTEARDSERQWHPLGHMQVCTSLRTDNHTSTPPLSFLLAGCPSCRPTNSVKALKAH